jgi:hypothetical protein
MTPTRNVSAITGRPPSNSSSGDASCRPHLEKCIPTGRKTHGRKKHQQKQNKNRQLEQPPKYL